MQVVKLFFFESIPEEDQCGACAVLVTRKEKG
jgi:hypothetical protein